MTGHQHQHPHAHPHGVDFDWEAMADRLELDAAITAPIVTQTIDDLDTGDVHRVLDVGCGPGAVAVQLATLLPTAHITALDSNEPLLQRARHAASTAGVDDRFHAVVGDLEQPLPQLEPSDLVWAGMVLHHVTESDTTLRRLHDALRPGGHLVMVEFGDTPQVLPAHDSLLTDGTWQRFQAATTHVLNERLGLDPVTIDWSAHLRDAGFVGVSDRGVVAEHAAPLDDVARAWLVPHLLRGLDMVDGGLSDDDVAAVRRLAEAVPDRDDLFVRVARRVLVARRP